MGWFKAKEKKDDAEDKASLRQAYQTDAHILSIDALEQAYLTSCSEGISQEVQREVLARDGPNRLSSSEEVSAWVLWAKSVFSGFFNLLLWAGALLCMIAYGLDQDDETNLYLGVVLAAVVLLTGTFSYYQDSNSAAIMAGFKSFLPEIVSVMRDGRPQSVPAEDLVVGDMIRIKGGERVPADARIVRCSNDVLVDNSSLTGESEPLPRSPNNTSEQVTESANMLFFGTKLLQGECEALIINTGGRTMMGRIARLADSTGSSETPLSIEIKAFIKIVSTVAVCLGITFLIVGLALGRDVISSLVFTIGIIVANVPEGLLATVTVSLALTAKRMSLSNVLVKNLEAVETLGSTSCICSDKTGTLTMNVMTVSHVYYDMRPFACDLDTEDAVANAKSEADINAPTFQQLLRVACLCNNTSYETVVEESGDDKTQVQRLKGDASEKGITRFIDPHFQKRYDGFRSLHPKLFGIPFNSSNKWQLSVHEMSRAPQLDSISKATFPILPNSSPEMHQAELLRDAHDFVEGVREYEEGGEEPSVVNWHDESETPEQKYLEHKGSFRSRADSISLSRPSRSLTQREVDLPSQPQVGSLPKNPVELDENGPLLVVKGAPEVVLTFCDKVMYRGKSYTMTPQVRADLETAIRRLGDLGERVLAFAHLPLDSQRYSPSYPYQGSTKSDVNVPLGQPKQDSSDKSLFGHFNDDSDKGSGERDEGLVFVGLMSMIDPPRPGVPEAVTLCRSAGIKVIMVTGDHPITAKAIARKVGIISSHSFTRHEMEDQLRMRGDGLLDGNVHEDDVRAAVVSGQELATIQSMSPNERARFWNTVLNKEDVVFARTSPQQKLLIVEACQQRGAVVAVTGDGVNDAPALKKADIGVSMGKAGSAVAQDASDMVLLDDNFASIVKGVEEGRLIFDNLKKSIAYTLSSNLPEIAPFLINIIIGLPLALTTVLILCVDLGTDMLPAISFAYEQKEADIMNRPPRNAKTDRMVSPQLISFAYTQTGFIQMIAMFFTFLCVMNDYGFKPEMLPGLAYGDDFGSTDMYCYVGSLVRCGYENAAEFFVKHGNDTNTFYHPELGAYFAANAGELLTVSAAYQNMALQTAQTAAFIAIVIVQISDVFICKTRYRSFFEHGMNNNFMIGGIAFEVALCFFLSYMPGVNTVFGARPLKFQHWLPAMPFCILMFIYDEVRKWHIRRNKGKWIDKATQW